MNADVDQSQSRYIASSDFFSRTYCMHGRYVSCRISQGRVGGGGSESSIRKLHAKRRFGREEMKGSILHNGVRISPATKCADYTDVLPLSSYVHDSPTIVDTVWRPAV